jgi:hypothetical protein
MAYMTPPLGRFPTAQLVSTRGVDELVTQGTLDPEPYLHRHFRGDWGDVDDEEAFINDKAFEYGGRLLSVYEITPTLRLWIITECDRSVTTLLLPSEYRGTISKYCLCDAI